MTMNRTTTYARSFLLLFALAFSSVGIVNAQEPVITGTVPPPPLPPNLCKCGGWSGEPAKIVSPIILTRVKCDGNVTVKKGSYSITSPSYNCYPSTKCPATYQWKVVGPLNGGPALGKTFTFNFSLVGTYVVTFTPICGGYKCPPCIFKVVVL